MKKSFSIFLSFIIGFSSLFIGCILPVFAATPNHLIINQVYGSGNNSDGAISKSFIEIYNPTNSDVDLNGWSVQYASSGDIWNSLELSGSIGAYKSLLIICNETSPNARYIIPQSDIYWNIRISNSAFKVALLNDSTLITVIDPNGLSTLVDFVGAGSTDASEGTKAADISKQKSIRRINFADTNDNFRDFQTIIYRASDGITADQLEIYRPRSLADGKWGMDLGITVDISAKKSLKNGELNMADFNITNNFTDPMEIVIIAAIYDENDGLVDSITEEIIAPVGISTNNMQIAIPAGENEYTLKYMAWYDLYDIQPICIVKTVTYSDYEYDGIIHLNGDHIVAHEINNVNVDGTVVTISAAGTYTIEGSLDDGQIIVRTPNKADIVNITLNGVNVSSSSSGPFFGAQGTIKINLAEGTVNTFTDASEYIYAPGEDEPNASFFSKRDLSIAGNGILNVISNYNNGIGTKAYLEIEGANITVSAINNALKGNSGIDITNAVLNILSDGDGMKSDNTGENEGIVQIKNSIVNITSGADGIQATADIVIESGSFNINSTEDAFNSDGAINISGGTFDITATQDAVQAETILNISGGNLTIKTGGGYNGPTTDESAKALKSADNIIITGGTFNINSKDDAVHSNLEIAISGGNFEIWTGDDGIHADETITIEAEPTINIYSSYEGIEAIKINLAGGNIHITASDDGINAAGGADQSGGEPGRPPGQGMGNGLINITDGYVVVNSTGDGLDANGNITMSGGTVIINGPSSSQDAAVDYDGTFVMSGGFILAAGSSQMAQAPGNTSTQRAVKITYRSQQTGLMSIRDSSGNDIVTFSPSKSYQSIMLSSPKLLANQTYTIYSGGTCTGTITDGLYNGGTYSGGTSRGSFNTSSITNNVTIN